MKPGILTTEFWLAFGGAGAILYEFAQKHCSFTDKDIYILGGIIVAYVLQRGWVKTRA